MIASLLIPPVQSPADKPLRWQCGWQSADLAIRRGDRSFKCPSSNVPEWRKGWAARIAFAQEAQ